MNNEKLQELKHLAEAAQEAEGLHQRLTKGDALARAMTAENVLELIALTERATEAGTPATAVQMPEPYNWCDPNAKYSMSQLQAYGEARAEEARREAEDRMAGEIDMLKAQLHGARKERDALFAAQRTAGGDAVAWYDPTNTNPGQSVTFKKEDRDRWPHIYRVALAPVEEAAAQADDGQSLHAQIAAGVAAVAPVDSVLATWPEEIYLTTGEDDELGKFESYSEVTWCDHPTNSVDVRYIRADVGERAKAFMAAYRAAPTAQPTPKENAPTLEDRGAGASLANVPTNAEASVAQPTPPDDERASPTFMDERQAQDWAWKVVRKDCDDGTWTTGESGNYFGFFLHGWRYREQYERQARAALRHPPVPNGGEPATTTTMCERKTNDIMQREGYQKTGYVLMKDDPAARICVSDQGAVSWFTRDQWNWLMHNRGHIEFQWPKPIAAAQPTQAGAEPAAFEHWWHEGAHPFRDISKRKNCQLNEDTAAMVWSAACADLRARLASAGAAHYELIATVTRKDTVVWEASDPIDIHDLEEGTKVYVLRAARQDSAAADKEEA